MIFFVRNYFLSAKFEHIERYLQYHYAIVQYFFLPIWNWTLIFTVISVDSIYWNLSVKTFNVWRICINSILYNAFSIRWIFLLWNSFSTIAYSRSNLKMKNQMYCTGTVFSIDWIFFFYHWVQNLAPCWPGALPGLFG